MSDEVDWGWVRDQLEEANVPDSVIVGVRELLEAWEDGEIKTPKDRDWILDLFSKLAKGHALSGTPDAEGTWVKGEPGDFVVGGTVRVRSDSFEGALGRQHNGRVGRVVGIRYGDVIVRSTDDKEPFLDGAHYSPYQLERKIG